MVQYLKQGKSVAGRAETDRQIRSTVESIIRDIERRGDAAVREYSEKFDQWSPQSFRLTQVQIDAAVASLSPQALADIQFAQDQASVQIGEVCSRLCALEHMSGHKEQADIRVRRLSQA